MNGGNPLYVTRPALPPLEELIPLLEEIWQSRILSNDGPFHRRLEQELCRFLGVDHICLVANATLGLILALRQLASEGEVITTPFSFVATSHAIVLAGLEPVFVDIDADSLNIDPVRVEAAVSSRTKALMPVHCFGRSCDVAALDEVAQQHGVGLIYDAAHAFAVQDDGGSILRHGDMSVLSFHATKVFNTFEGGAVVCRSASTKTAIDKLRNFGIEDEVTVTVAGLNAKMNEFNAAVGLVQLGHIDGVIARRKVVHDRYREILGSLPGIRCLPESVQQTQNYYSFPILVESFGRNTRDRLYAVLREEGIHARRYFYPLISELPMYRQYPSACPDNLKVARRVASEILCLPVFPDLTENEQLRVMEVIERFARDAA
jgi:dTDP-4-amino-4,6-dideoxygalactose transaminase